MTKEVTADVVAAEEIEPMAMSEIGITVQRDPTRIAALMAGRYEHADTLDAMFAVTEGNTSARLVGKTFEILSVEWDAFESDTGLIPLAIVDSVDKATGKREEWATTGGMLTRFIRAAEVKGFLPFTARIEEKLTRSGQKALNFVRP